MNKKELEDLICELYGIDKPTDLIKNQISKFVVQHGYAYKDIGRAFYYYKEILGRETRLQAGIGIVPYYIDDAIRYFELKKRELDKLEAEGKKLKDNSAAQKDDIVVSEVKREVKGVVKVDLKNI